MIGLLGGTFDPIHFGHLRTSLEVMEALNLEAIRFLPAPRPRLRDQPILSPEQRIEMVRLAISGQPGFELDVRELNREGPTYTVDTLRQIRADIGGSKALVLIMGSDAFARLTQWYEWEKLIELSHIAVMMRPDAHLNAGDLPSGWLNEHLTEISGDLSQMPAGRVMTVSVTQLAISATDIRQRLRQGKSIRYLLPEPVLAYIEQHGLYRN